MKIVLIHGQNHKGSTYHIGRSIADGIGCEKEINLVRDEECPECKGSGAKPGSTVKKGEALFPRIDIKKELDKYFQRDTDKK